MINQQIVISGVGGQGVLFVTRLLAEAAIQKGLPVFTSETHGMAQRGGTVISHLKVGEFSSPLIRPSQADGLLALKAENLSQHGAYLKPTGWTVANGTSAADSDNSLTFFADADVLAQKIGNPKAVNLILLGFSLAKVPTENLFCSFEDIKDILKNRLAKKQDMLEASVVAIEAGYTFS
jgi:indolepyruvate ferredoxin oxidoreductase beta subunit